MTVTATTNQQRFNGGGTTGPFTWNWRFLANEDIEVYRIADPDAENPLEVRTLLTEGDDYTLTGARLYTGGSMTLVDALAVGTDLLVLRNTRALQPIDLRNQGNNFFPEVHEDVFDSLTMIAQDVERKIDKLSVAEAIDAALVTIAKATEATLSSDRAESERIAAGVHADNAVLAAAAAEGYAGAALGTFGDVNVMWYGVKGDGTNETTLIQSIIDASDSVYFPVPPVAYAANLLTIPAGKKIRTAGKGTIFQQLPQTLADKRFMYVTGSNVEIESLTLKGNIATDINEQNHGIFIRGAADISNITIGDIHGEDIRGDVVYVGGLATAKVSDVKIGSVSGDNIYRNVVSVTGGENVKIESATGENVGFLIFDIEPNANSQACKDIEIRSIKGGVAGVIGYQSTKIVSGVRIGSMDLNPAWQSNSTPAYSVYNVSVAFLTRNVKGLIVDHFKAEDFTDHAYENIYDGPSGDVRSSNITFNYIEWLNCSTTEVTYHSSSKNDSVNDLTVNGGSVVLSTLDKMCFLGSSSAPKTSTVNISHLSINGLIAKHVGNSNFSFILADSAFDKYLLQNVYNSRVASCALTGLRLAGFCDDLVFINSQMTISGIVFNSSYENHLLIFSTINAVDYENRYYLYPTLRNVGAPANATAAGKPGDVAITGTFFYTYTGNGTSHTWVRSAAAAW